MVKDSLSICLEIKQVYLKEIFWPCTVSLWLMLVIYITEYRRSGRPGWASLGAYIVQITSNSFSYKMALDFRSSPRFPQSSR